jgi:hypothetical protein
MGKSFICFKEIESSQCQKYLQGKYQKGLLRFSTIIILINR